MRLEETYEEHMNKLKRTALPALILCFLAFSQQVVAIESDTYSLYFDVNGLSKHLDTDYDYNEKNDGFGLTAENNNNGNVKKLIAGTFINSFNDRTIYLATGRAKRFGNEYYADLGAIAGLMTGYDSTLFPMAAATLSLGKKGVGRINFTYNPTFGDHPSVITMNIGIQFK